MTQMLAPGGTCASIFSFWIDMPVCEPPFGNATHSVHLGRRHSWPNTAELAVIVTVATRKTTPRIHFLHFNAEHDPEKLQTFRTKIMLQNIPALAASAHEIA